MVGIGPGKYTSISLPVHFNFTPSICSHSAQYIQRCPSNEKKGYKFSYNYKLYPGKSLRFPVISLILQKASGFANYGRFTLCKHLSCTAHTPYNVLSAKKLLELFSTTWTVNLSGIKLPMFSKILISFPRR